MNTYGSFIEKRDLNQEEIAKAFCLNTNGITLIESPTGSGKTRIAILSALEKQKKSSNTPVIISTNTNKNAIDLRELAMLPLEHDKKGFGLTDKEVCIEVGMSNYVNISLLAIELIKDGSILPISIKTLDKMYKINEDIGLPLYRTDILKEDFLKEFDIDEKTIRPFLQSQGDILGKKELSHISEQLKHNKIIITNHIYLIVLYRFFGNFKNHSIPDDIRELFLSTPIIIDEFHTLYDSAKVILTDNFSLFQLKNTASGFLNNAPQSSNKTLIKKIENIKEISVDIQNELKNFTEKDEDLIKNKAVSLIASLKEKINHRNGIELTIKQLQKADMSQNDELEKYTIALIKELSELANINVSNKKTQVSFSPKGYPTFILSNGIPSYRLRSELWIKCNAPILGMSGTLRTINDTTKDSYRWVMERNGFYRVNINDEKERLERQEYDYLQKENMINKHFELNRKIEETTFIKYSSLFKSSNFLMHFFTDSELETPRHPNRRDSEEYKKEFEYKKDVWYDNTANVIANTLKCNSLILTMSFDDVDEIHKRLKLLRTDVDFCIAERGGSMNKVVEKHKTNVNKNILSCIIGTEQYYTGLDLPGEYLKEVFMVKLPYKPILGELGKKIYSNMSFSKSESYENEVLFKILQGAGRGIRDYHDKAILYILDPRLMHKRRSKDRTFLQQKGYEINIESLFKTKTKFLNCPARYKHENIYSFFGSVLITKNIEKIVELLKIDDLDLAEEACKKLNDLNVSVLKYGIDDFKTDTKSEKYNFWVHLLKIAIKNNILLGGCDYQSKIIENNLYGFKTVEELSRSLFSIEEEYDDLDSFFSTRGII